MMNQTLKLDILYVEDDPDHADLAMMCLEEQTGIGSIHHVCDGQSALDYLLRRGPYADPEKSPRPSIILLDLRLPRIDGLEVLRIIRNTESIAYIPVIILTTSEAPGDIETAYRCAANSYLVKPIDFDRFNTILREAARYWLEVNRVPAAVN